MRTTRTNVLTALSAGVIFVVGCSSDEENPIFVPPDSSATGGSSGAGAGGRASGGRPVGSGGRSSGGVSGGGAGGANAGGANAGGSNAGGTNAGGTNAGGANTGGAATGGAATDGGPDGSTGGAGTGGAGTGGANTGGAGTGGANTGGAGTGGAGTGGAPPDGGGDGGVQKLVFVTSDIFAGNFGAGDAGSGLAAADQICNDSAAAAGLNGTFMAWLSDANTNAFDRIANVGPWYLVTGQKVFDNKDALKSNPLHAINVDESGATVAASAFQVLHPWTGTKADGTKDTNTCNSWTVTTGNGMCGLATSTTNGNWTEGSPLPCNIPYSFYCFEQ